MASSTSTLVRIPELFTKDAEMDFEQHCMDCIEGYSYSVLQQIMSYLAEAHHVRMTQITLTRTNYRVSGQGTTYELPEYIKEYRGLPVSESRKQERTFENEVNRRWQLVAAEEVRNGTYRVPALLSESDPIYTHHEQQREVIAKQMIREGWHR